MKAPTTMDDYVWKVSQLAERILNSPKFVSGYDAEGQSAVKDAVNVAFLIVDEVVIRAEAYNPGV